MKVYLVNEHEDGFDAVTRVFAKLEDAEAFAEELRQEKESDDGQADYEVYIGEREVY
jgi:hypothetical protein